jgi:hypothetical protein
MWMCRECGGAAWRAASQKRWTVCVPTMQIRLDFQDLDLTTEDVNFDAIDDDLKRFQQDDIVKDALEKVWLQSAS